MNWYSTLIASQSNEYLKGLLGERYPGVGPEQQTALPNDIKLCKDPYGSFRFIKSVNGVNVSAIQVMKREGQPARIANAYTHPNFRRMGYATELFNAAKGLLGEIQHSDDLSGDGEGFANSFQQPPKFPSQ